MYISAGLFERSMPADEAIAIAKKFILDKDLSFKISQIGENTKTVLCEIIDYNHVVATGRGKGISNQAIASGLFEAIEHLYSVFPALPQEMPVKKVDLDGDDFFLRKSSPIFELYNSSDLFFSRVPFKNVISGEIICFPYFLTDPHYISKNELERRSINQNNLSRYSSNSGTAAGTSKNDAILHALLEIIERDAIAITLISSVIKKPADCLRVLSKSIISSEIAKLISNIELEKNCQVKIWDITSDLGIPVILAEIKTVDFTVYGSGASLSMKYAIERSVLEALQCLDVFESDVDGSLINLINENAKKLKKLPTFLKCYLNGGIFEYQGGEINVMKYEYIDKMDFNNSLDQIQFICEKLTILKIDVYYRNILDENGVYVCQLVAPALERFFLVSYGSAVLPNSRGQKIIDKE